MEIITFNYCAVGHLLSQSPYSYTIAVVEKTNCSLLGLDMKIIPETEHDRIKSTPPAQAKIFNEYNAWRQFRMNKPDHNEPVTAEKESPFEFINFIRKYIPEHISRWNLITYYEQFAVSDWADGIVPEGLFSSEFIREHPFITFTAESFFAEHPECADDVLRYSNIKMLLAGHVNNNSYMFNKYTSNLVAVKVEKDHLKEQRSEIQQMWKQWFDSVLLQCKPTPLADGENLLLQLANTLSADPQFKQQVFVRLHDQYGYPSSPMLFTGTEAGMPKEIYLKVIPDVFMKCALSKHGITIEAPLFETFKFSIENVPLIPNFLLLWRMHLVDNVRNATDLNDYLQQQKYESLRRENELREQFNQCLAKSSAANIERIRCLLLECGCDADVWRIKTNDGNERTIAVSIKLNDEEVATSVEVEINDKNINEAIPELKRLTTKMEAANI